MQPKQYGRVISVEFVDDDGMMMDGSTNVEPGTYVTIRLDDIRANVGPGDVVISPADERISPMTGLPSLSANK